MKIRSVICALSVFYFFLCSSNILAVGTKFQHQKHNRKAANHRFERSLDDIQDKKLREKASKWMSSLSPNTKTDDFCDSAQNLLPHATRYKDRTVMKNLNMAEALRNVPATSHNRTINPNIVGVKKEDTILETCDKNEWWAQGKPPANLSDIKNMWEIESQGAGSYSVQPSLSSSASSLSGLATITTPLLMTTESSGHSSSASSSGNSAPSFLLVCVLLSQIRGGN